MTFPDDNLEFEQCWSGAAGEVGAWHQAIGLIEQKAAQAYIRRQDEAATALRDVARELKEKQREAQLALQAYIEEGNRRNFEQTKHLKK